VAATTLYPFVPSGPRFAESLAFFRELGFSVEWNDAGLAGLRNGNAYFLLQDINVPEWQSNQMITYEVDDLDGYWLAISRRDLPGTYDGVSLKPPTDYPWGREIHIIDPGGVCWHVRQAVFAHAITHILVVGDPGAARRFWVDVVGAELYRAYGDSTVLRWHGTWLLLVADGEQLFDRPTVAFAPPTENPRVSHAITIRVADCHEAYDRMVARGAVFLTPPYDQGSEVRCYFRDPDGHLIELCASAGASV
jgi:catechol 2,3-dioxygenase-like lactoylglutathione lyase family enzyme